MEIREKQEFVGHVIIEAIHARNLYYIHVKASAGVIEAISIVRNDENVLIFDRDNFGWQIRPADKQTKTVYRETLKHLSLKPVKETAQCQLGQESESRTRTAASFQSTAMITDTRPTSEGCSKSITTPLKESGI